MSIDTIARGLAASADGTAAAQPSVYLGQVATRCFPCLASVSSSTATWSSGRTMHWARDTIKSPVVVFASWWVSTSNVETLVTGGTVKAAIELTLGTRAAQNVEGAVSYVNGYAVCTFPGLVIPHGSQFWVDHLVVNANGIAFTGFPQLSMDPTEGWAFSTGTPTDYTVSGTPPQPFQLSQGYGPILILSQTQHPSFLLIGTSRHVGQNDYATDMSGDRGQIARLIGRKFGYTNLGVSTSTLAAFNSASKTYRNQITSGTIAGIATGVPYHSHIDNEYGINDLTSGGDSAAALAMRRAAFAAAYPAHIVIGNTLTPNPASTDNFDTLANQTPNAKVQTFNDLVRAGIAGERIIWDVSDLIDPTRTGKWPVDRDPHDISVTPASFTGVISGNTLTASSVTGTIAAGAQIHGTNVATAQTIMPYGTSSTTGAGGAGTYAVTQSQTVSSEAMTADAAMTWEGLHESATANGLIRDRGMALLALVQR